MNDKPNKVTTVLKVVVTVEFYDDDATEETLRYAVEQDLEDAGFDVDVALLKEQDPVEPELEGGGSTWWHVCGECHGMIDKNDLFCRHCGKPVKQT